MRQNNILAIGRAGDIRYTADYIYIFMYRNKYLEKNGIDNLVNK